MDLSIIIPSFNTRRLLERCLDSIADSLKDSKLSYEIIVIDNASTDGSIQLLNTKYTRIQKIFNKSNLGYGKANNIAIQRAKGEYILLLNSDIQVLEDGIDKLVAFGRSKKDSFIGGKLFDEDRTPQTSCGPEFTLLNIFLMLFFKADSFAITRYSPTTVKKVAWVSGSCLMATKQAFIDAGLFDEQIFMYMDEVDLLYRARKKGYTVFFYPDAHFIHSGAASSKNKKTPVINIYFGLRYYYKKHRSIIEGKILECMLWCKAVAAIILGKLFHKEHVVHIYEQALSVGKK